MVQIWKFLRCLTGSRQPAEQLAPLPDTGLTIRARVQRIALKFLSKASGGTHIGSQCHTCTLLPTIVAVMPIICDSGVLPDVVITDCSTSWSEL